jgi:molybdopterin-guanine dinucleotide biosynthesis protein B
MEYRAVAFTGPSNSGKTTIIEKISKRLNGKKRVAIIKNDPKDKAVFDKEGKDSDRFYKTGAEVAVVSPTRTTIFSHRSRDMEEVARLLSPFDLLLVEGLKSLPLPRIAVFRGAIDIEYLSVVEAIAIDDTIDPEEADLPDNIDILDLNDTDAIIEWIDDNSVKLKGLDNADHI